MKENDNRVFVDKPSGLFVTATESDNDTWIVQPYGQDKEHLQFKRKSDDLLKVGYDDTIYDVSIEFYNDDIPYGTVNVYMVANNEDEALEKSKSFAEDSFLYDPRIPDRYYNVYCELDESGLLEEHVEMFHLKSPNSSLQSMK